MKCMFVCADVIFSKRYNSRERTACHLSVSCQSSAFKSQTVNAMQNLGAIPC